MSTHTGAVTVVRFSPCGRYLASGSDDRVVLIWELDETRAPRQEFGSNTSGGSSFGPGMGLLGGIGGSGGSQGAAEQNSETWVARKRLLGHDNDVQDLAWAPDSSILVTVGLDSGIIIWSGSTFEKLKKFDIHQSHVKGVAFDPANKYFATASDDRSVKIIRYHHTASNEVSFSVETTIASPFKGSPLSTYYRRCSWSPDGNHISAANATNGPVPTVTIINRGTWDSDISLVGHDAPCEVASFCPRIFCLDQQSVIEGSKGNGDDYKNLISVIATAGQDKTLAIWNTSSPRPLLVARNVAEKSITDIAWSGDGSKLYASSLDGTILVASFDPGELGWVVPLSANEIQLTRYGGGKEALQIPASTGILELEEVVEATEKVAEKDHHIKAEERDRILDNIMGSNPSNTTNSFDKGESNTDKKTETSAPAAVQPVPKAAPAPAVNVLQPRKKAAEPQKVNQKVTITKDGKKRIAPMLISGSLTPTSNASRPAAVQAKPAGASVSGPLTVKQAIDYAPAANVLPQGGISTLIIGSKRRGEVLEEVSGVAGGDALAANNSGNTNGSAATNGPHTKKSKSQYTEVHYIRPPLISPASAVSQVRLGVPKVKSFFARKGGSTTSPNSTDASNTTSSTISKPDATNGTSNSAASDSATSAGPGTTPASGPGIIGPQSGESLTSFGPTTILEIRNSGKDKEPTRILVTRGGNAIFMDYLPRYAILAAGSGDRFWAVSTEDGAIYVYSPSGRRLFPPIVIGAPLSFLESEGDILIAISSIGMVYVWDIIGENSSPYVELCTIDQGPRALHPPVSIAPVLDGSSKFSDDGLVRAPKLTHASVTPQGKPVVTLSSGESFIYSAQMMVWTKVSENWWAGASQYWDTTTSSLSSISNIKNIKGNASNGLITLLERRTTSESLLSHNGRGSYLQKLARSRMVKEGYEAFEQQVSISHLEHRMSAALVAESPYEYASFVKMYAEKVAELGMEDKLEEICRELWGPIGFNGSQQDKKKADSDGDLDLTDGNISSIFGTIQQPPKEPAASKHTDAWSRFVCGAIDKHELLKDIVLVTGKYREAQKVIAKYAVAVGVISDIDTI